MKKITTNSDSFRLALGFLMIGQFCGLSLDILAKHLLEEYSLSQFIFARSLFALIIFSFIAPWYGGLESIKTKRWKWHFLRAVLSIVAMFGFFYGITIPLLWAMIADVADYCYRIIWLSSKRIRRMATLGSGINWIFRGFDYS